MRIVGVIAEYNPFHSGHAHQLRQAREAAHADAVVAVMSGCFMQRGDAAIVSPAIRAKMALQNGADAVILLPALWSVRDAEHFALGGVHLLTGLGCDALSFGAETADLPLLQAAVDALESPDLPAAIQPHLSAGLPYPAALSAAMAEVAPAAARVLQSPNNTLGVCYLRALRRLGASTDVYPIARASDYHASAIGDGFSSATAIRSAILRGDWSSAYSAMPGSAADLLENQALANHLHRSEALDSVLLARLRLMDEVDYAALPDISEGIERRLRRFADTARTRETLLQAAKTRRYPYARLSRLATHALLGVTQAVVGSNPLPPAAFLLGFRRGCEPLLSHLAQGVIPLVSSAAQCGKDAAWAQVERRAWGLWALGAGYDGDMWQRHGVVRGECKPSASSSTILGANHHE